MSIIKRIHITYDSIRVSKQPFAIGLYAFLNNADFQHIIVSALESTRFIIIDIDTDTPLSPHMRTTLSHIFKSKERYVICLDRSHINTTYSILPFIRTYRPYVRITSLFLVTTALLFFALFSSNVYLTNVAKSYESDLQHRNKHVSASLQRFHQTLPLPADNLILFLSHYLSLPISPQSLVIRKKNVSANAIILREHRLLFKDALPLFSSHVHLEGHSTFKKSQDNRLIEWILNGQIQSITNPS